MSPEYLGETLGHPMVEIARDPFIILGGESEVTKVFAEAWTTVTNSHTRIYQVSGKTAELCKLMENSFLATKVMFCNEFFTLAKEIGVDYNILREIFLLDSRVGRSHTYVFDDNRGFSGKCLLVGTKIQTPQGERNIEELTINDVLNTDIGITKVVDVSLRDVEETIRIRARGRELIGSTDHIHLIKHPHNENLLEKELKDVNVGDWMFVPKPAKRKTKNTVVFPSKPNN
jgi:UDP-glucose 6-dehydrogenase